MIHTLNLSYVSPSGQISKQLSATAEAVVEMDVAVAGDAANLLVNFAAVRAQTKTLVLLADQNMTVKTNSSSAPDDTITLAAGVPFILFDGFAPANTPADYFSADITKLYVTNDSSPDTAGTLQIRSLQDPTP